MAGDRLEAAAEHRQFGPFNVHFYDYRGGAPLQGVIEPLHCHADRLSRGRLREVPVTKSALPGAVHDVEKVGDACLVAERRVANFHARKVTAEIRREMWQRLPGHMCAVRRNTDRVLEQMTLVGAYIDERISLGEQSRKQ